MPVASARAQSLPLYVQITELLLREIGAGRWLHGERLPPEADLAARLGVAVGTLRKALAELESRGVLERRQGSGTYVRAATAGRSIYEFFRLERLDGAGLPTAEVLALDRVPRPPQWPAPLDTPGEPDAPAGGACWRVRRLRFLDREPVAVEEIWFDARHRAALGIADLNESLYYFYQQQLGFWISHVEDHLTLGTVPAWAPAAFGLPAGAATVQIERRSWSQTGRIEEVSLTWIDPARTHYAARWR